jgi:rubrerythrin
MSNFEPWLSYFQQNRLNRPEPDWSMPTTLSDSLALAIAKSLSHFQLGESGEGSHLFEKAAKETSERHLECLRLFIKEEQEHARLLEQLILRFKGKLVTSHWTDSLFCHLRRFLNFQWELQILLTAEIIGTAYYTLMGEYSADTLLWSVCDTIVSDEDKHLEFHRDYFQGLHQSKPEIIKMLWNWQFGMLLFLTSQLAWMDHGPCLKMLGTDKKQFFREIKALQDFCSLKPATGINTLVPSGISPLH